MNKLLLALAAFSLPCLAFATDNQNSIQSISENQNIADNLTEASAPVAEPGSNSSRVSTHELISLSADVRIDYQHESTDGNTVDGNTGFEGKYFMFRVDGEIIPGLTYSWRQRLNKPHKDASFFDATDWIYLDWAVGRWNLSAGKEIVAIGGWEYDRHPIDLYSTSVFWQNIPCYQFGATVKYAVTDSDKLSFQAVQSPFHSEGNRNLYSYNLFWSGTHGIYQALWSANMVEYRKNHYISYLALGNRFSIGNVTFELDFMNRATSHQTFLFRDMSVMTELAWTPARRWRIHGKYTYDVNHADNDADFTVLPGTELSMAGGGVEFYPLVKKKTSLRLHANAYYSWGKNANSADVMQNKSLMCSVGIRWHMDLFSFKH